jgi:hypothetical protein
MGWRAGEARSLRDRSPDPPDRWSSPEIKNSGWDSKKFFLNFFLNLIQGSFSDVLMTEHEKKEISESLKNPECSH